MEYLVNMTTHVPDGTPDQAVNDIRAREAAHSRELAAAGHLMRLWRPPLQPTALAQALIASAPSFSKTRGSRW